jgi:hypothetical protein
VICPISASQVARIMGMRHQAWVWTTFANDISDGKEQNVKKFKHNVFKKEKMQNNIYLIMEWEGY